MALLYLTKAREFPLNTEDDRDVSRGFVKVEEKFETACGLMFHFTLFIYTEFDAGSKIPGNKNDRSLSAFLWPFSFPWRRNTIFKM